MSVKGGVMVPHPPLIVPEIGRGEEGKIQATVDAYHQAARKIAQWKPDTVVVISPHSVMYADYFHISPGKGTTGNFARFRAPQVKFRAEYDTEFAGLLEQEAEARDIPAGTLGERDPHLDHGTMVPLWFLDQYDRDYRLVRIGLSGLCPVCPWPYIMNWDSASGRQRNFWTGISRSSEAAICPIS